MDVLPEATGMTTWTNAALGLNVPAEPPISFQALTVPPTVIEMSWFTPATDVQRSLLAVIRRKPSAGATTDALRLVASMSFQVVPSLPARLYCPVETIEVIVVGVATGTSWLLMQV